MPASRATGWRYRAFLEEPRGAIELNGRDVRIRGVPRRGERLMRAIEQAYADKYTTPASLKYVAGFVVRAGARRPWSWCRGSLVACVRDLARRAAPFVPARSSGSTTCCG